MATIPLPALHVQENQQSPLALYAQAQQILNARQQNQLLGLETQRQQIGLEQTQALNRSYAEAIKPDENGIPQIDTGVLTKSLAASNAGAAIPGAIESVTKYNKSLVDLKTAQTDLQSKSNDLMGHAAAAVKNAGYDPRLAHTLLDTLPGVNPAVRAKIDDPVQLKQLVDSAIAQSPKERELAAQETTAQARSQQAQLSAQEFAAKLPGGALQPVEQKELTDWLSKNPGKGASDFVAWKAKQTPLARLQIENAAAQPPPGGTSADVAKRFGMTPEAFDQAAEKYYQTGQMPSMGRGISGIGLQRAIMNRTAELHAGESLAESSAEYAANKQSLGKLQSNLDQVTAFENTANKNLDMFTNLAQKAINTGIPLLNAPLRTGAKLLAGSENQLAMDAARQVAVNEIAKVTGSPGLSGQLSDTARKEVASFIPESATYGQALRVAQVLKQDMANRHQSYQQQIGDIQNRLGGKGNAPPPGHVIAIGDKQYRYNGSGDTSDLKNYTEVKK